MAERPIEEETLDEEEEEELDRVIGLFRWAADECWRAVLRLQLDPKPIRELLVDMLNDRFTGRASVLEAAWGARAVKGDLEKARAQLRQWVDESINMLAEFDDGYD